jgi:nicotinamide riboside transporter PnuC
VKLLIKAVDWIAILIAVLTITVLLPLLVFQGIVGVFGVLGSMFRHPSDIIILLIVTAGFAWCAFRWKELNKRP